MSIKALFTCDFCHVLQPDTTYIIGYNGDSSLVSGKNEQVRVVKCETHLCIKCAVRVAKYAYEYDIWKPSS